MQQQLGENDVVIVSAVRTPLTKARKGAFKNAHPELLLSSVLKSVCERAGIQKENVQDISVGTVLSPGSGATISRMAMFHAGFPETTTITTVNRQCSSGLQAVANIAAAIKAGYIEIGIGAGVESMSLHYGPGSMPESIDQSVRDVQQAADCLIPMGVTSENVAKQFGISRLQQDSFACESHRRAAVAQSQGCFRTEIVPVTLSDGTVVSQDDGIRKETSTELLAKLRPSFCADGTTTAGNASQVTDGAAALLLMKRSAAERLGVPVIAKFVDFVVCGVPPRIMGIGPAVAIPMLLARNKLAVDQVDLFEINEAFASQAVYCIKTLGIPENRVNMAGGAIALGHPLGCTGARQLVTAIQLLLRSGKKVAITSMCIGTGMGAASLIVREEKRASARL